MVKGQPQGLFLDMTLKLLRDRGQSRITNNRIRHCASYVLTYNLTNIESRPTFGYGVLLNLSMVKNEILAITVAGDHFLGPADVKNSIKV
jgi:hypothetical protein